MNTKKITIRLNLDKENDRMAWEILQSHKGQSYTETLVEQQNLLCCNDIETAEQLEA